MTIIVAVVTEPRWEVRNGTVIVDVQFGAMSSDLDIIPLLSAWANTHLTAAGCSTDNILTGLMEGETMKLLLESMQLG